MLPSRGVQSGLRHAVLIAPTIAVAIGVESARRGDWTFPIPFLLLYAASLLGAGLGGRVVGVITGVIAAGFVLYASTVPFGPTTLTGGSVQVLFGISLYVGTAGLLGTIRTERDRLVFAQRQHEEDLERLVAERSAQLSDSVSSLRAEVESHRRTGRDLLMAQQIVGSSRELVAVVDSTQRLEFVNPQFASYFELPADQLVGMRLGDLDGADELRAVAESGPSETQDRGEDGPIVTIKVPRGLRTLEVEVIPLVDDTGVLVALVLDGRDVTERIEAQLARQAADDQLQTGLKLQALGGLAGGVAHEFNNLLTAILGYSEQARSRIASREDSASIMRQLDVVISSGERARDIISQMLAFSRTGRSGSARPLDVSAEVREVMELTEPVLPATIQLEVDLQTDLSPVVADPIQFQQAVMNLVINARDAIESVGQIRVRSRQTLIHDERCSSCAAPIEGNFVELVVEDSGPGLDQAVVEKAFEPFFSTKDMGEGTGMGLSIVHGVTHSHDGHVQVRVGGLGGAGVRLLLPVALNKIIEPADRSTEDRAVRDERSVRATIVVVDDDVAVAELLASYVRDHDHQTLVFTDPVEADRWMEQNHAGFDLLLTDQMMPGLTGVDLAARVRERRPALPVIVCSATAVDLDDRAQTYGYLAKPTSSDALISEVNAQLLDE
ncbi:MAG: hybrid sensor histidine kinase/response regulator [Acidimicrobiales bacterium]